MPLVPKSLRQQYDRIWPEINRMGGYTDDRYKWGMAWHKYTDDKIQENTSLRTKWESVRVGASDFALVARPHGEHVKTLAMYPKVFGFDRRWLLRKEPFTTPGWWWVAMDPAHQRMSGLTFPYKPKKAK